MEIGVERILKDILDEIKIANRLKAIELSASLPFDQTKANVRFIIDLAKASDEKDNS